MGNPYDTNAAHNILTRQRNKKRRQISDLQKELEQLEPGNPYDLGSRAAEIRNEIMRLTLSLNNH